MIPPRAHHLSTGKRYEVVHIEWRNRELQSLIVDRFRDSPGHYFIYLATAELDGWQLEQATGLTDKNGSPWGYVNDLVRITFDDEYHDEVISIEEGGVFEGRLRYRDGAFLVEGAERVSLFLFSLWQLDYVDIEIVGQHREGE